MAARAVCHSVLEPALEMTTQAAVQRVLALAAHGVPVQRPAGAAHQMWPPGRVVLKRPTTRRG
jgi:hypothetical protein